MWWMPANMQDFVFIITSNIYMKLTASDLQWCNLVLHILKCMAQSLLFHYSGDSQQCFILVAFSQMIFLLKIKKHEWDNCFRTVRIKSYEINVDSTAQIIWSWKNLIKIWSKNLNCPFSPIAVVFWSYAKLIKQPLISHCNWHYSWVKFLNNLMASACFCPSCPDIVFPWANFTMSEIWKFIT